MVLELFNGKIINEDKLEVINKTESCFIDRQNIESKVDTLIKLIKSFDNLSKGECIVLKYIIESRIKLFEEFNKVIYEFEANSDFCTDVERYANYNYASIKDALSNLYKKNIIIRCRVPGTDEFYKTRYSLNSQYCPKNIITNTCKAIIINL